MEKILLPFEIYGTGGVNTSAAQITVDDSLLDHITTPTCQVLAEEVNTIRSLVNVPSTITTNIVENNGSYTAQASDFTGFAHTIFIFTNTSQVDMILPMDLVPTDNIWSVKMFSGESNPSNRVLLGVSGTGRIDSETDLLIMDDECLTCVHRGGNQHSVLSDYDPTVIINNYLSGASFDNANRTLSLPREGLSDLNVVIPSSSESHDTFFNEITRDGDKYTMSDNIAVDESNVIESMDGAINLPHTYDYSLAYSDTTEQTLALGTDSISFLSLEGGSLLLGVSFTTSYSSGSSPELIDLTLTYGSTAFVFPLGGVSVDEQRVIEIAVPNADYTSILNTSCDVSLRVNYRGLSFNGSMVINTLINKVKGSLHDAIQSIASIEAVNAEMKLESEIDALRSQVIGDENNLNSISDRISPYKSIGITIPEFNQAFFLDSTGADGFPDLANMHQVSDGDNTFTITGTYVFLAVPLRPPNSSVSNILDTSLGEILVSSTSASTNPDLEIGRSETLDGTSYGVFRVSGLTATETIAIEKITSEQVVEWDYDIKSLEDSVDAINTKLENPIFDMPEEVAVYLDNDVSVNQADNTSFIPSDYNNSLIDGAGYGIHNEAVDTPSPVNGITSSGTISSSITRGNKLVIIDPKTYSGGYIVRGNNGTPVDLISYAAGDIFVETFLTGSPGGSQSTTVRPYPSLSVPQDWYTIATHDGNLTAEADELFFQNGLPSSATDLTFSYRYLANGSPGPTQTAVISNVGGVSDVSTSYTLSLPDGESISVRFDWQRSLNRIRIEADPNANNQNFFIFDMQVSLSWVQTRVIPPTPDKIVKRQIATYDGSSDLVFAIKPSTTRVDSNTATVVIVSKTVEIDTGYLYNTVFGTADSGVLNVNSDSVNIYDFINDATSALLMEYFNRSRLPYNGLFTVQHNYSDVLVLDSQIEAADSVGNKVKLGSELILVSPNDSKWRVKVSDDGTLSTSAVI